MARLMILMPPTRGQQTLFFKYPFLEFFFFQFHAAQNCNLFKRGIKDNKDENHLYLIANPTRKRDVYRHFVAEERKVQVAYQTINRESWGSHKVLLSWFITQLGLS